MLPPNSELIVMPTEDRVRATFPVIEEQVKRFSYSSCGNLLLDDLRSAGQVALWRACQNFTKGNLDAEVRQRVRWAMTDEWRRQTLSRLKGQKPTYIELDHNFLSESGVDPFLREELESKVNHLKPKQRTLVRELYFIEKSAAELASAWGVTKNRIFQIHREAMTKLSHLVAA